MSTVTRNPESATDFADSKMNVLLGILSSANQSLMSDPWASRKLIKNAILIISNSEMPVKETGKGLTKRQLQHIESFVHHHLDKNLNMNVLASVVHMSVGQFSRSFKSSLGITTKAYIKQQRLKKACSLMLQTDLSLTNIALQIGLCDQAHLTNFFKELTGETPLKWRKKHTLQASI
jgi:transcriptional regulator GlxA family with amidase domain